MKSRYYENYDVHFLLFTDRTRAFSNGYASDLNRSGLHRYETMAGLGPTQSFEFALVKPVGRWSCSRGELAPRRRFVLKRVKSCPGAVRKRIR